MTVADVLAGRASWAVAQGDCLDVLRSMPDGCVQVCATSPPYFGLRSYLPADHPDKALEVGLEPTLDAYVARLVLICREVRRVLHPTGTLWLNVGDSYATNPGNGRGGEGVRRGSALVGGEPHRSGRDRRGAAKPKDLLMVPATVALALRADGWWLRSDVIWHKTACMPESVTDRPTSSHEHVFLLSKRATDYYDADAVREDSSDDVRATWSPDSDKQGVTGTAVMDSASGRRYTGFNKRWNAAVANGTAKAGRNLRNVWTLREPMMRLRRDLTPEQRAYVLRRLAGTGGADRV